VKSNTCSWHCLPLLRAKEQNKLILVKSWKSQSKTLIKYNSFTKYLGLQLHLDINESLVSKVVPLYMFVSQYWITPSFVRTFCCMGLITVIKNGKFSTIIPYDDKRVRLCHCCIPLNFPDFKDLKKLKKVNKGRKGQMKGQNTWNTAKPRATL